MRLTISRRQRRATPLPSEGRGHRFESCRAHLEFEREMIARKASERMNDNDVERRRFGQGHVEQALEFRPAVIHAACVRLDELNRNIPTACGAEGEHLPPLIRNAEIGPGLPRGRDCTARRGTAQARGSRGWTGHDRAAD
jgi:hypothetical protein